MNDWKGWVFSKLSEAIGFYFVDQASTSPHGDDFLRTAPAKPPGQPGRIHARRMWPFGLRSIVPAGVEAVTVAPMGSATQKVMVGAESPAYGPNDLKEGETALYCKINGTLVKLDLNGNNAINSGTPAGGTQGDVVVNGGTAPVGRKGDHCKINPANVAPGFLANWMFQVEFAINALAPGSVSPVASTFLSAPGIVIDEGAAHFKG